MSASIEVAVDRSTLVCRGCLTEWGEMKNMYESGLDVDFFRYTDVLQEPSEAFPVLLCSECEEDLKKTKDFIERCQESDRILKQNMKMEAKHDCRVNKSRVSSILGEDKLVLMITAPDSDDKISLPCPFDCDEQFFTKPILRYHLKNIHGLAEDFEIDQQYYCTVEGCLYNSDSIPNKCFSGRKFLNQHLNKIHKAKTYYCQKCSKRFSLKTELYRHMRTCKLTYSCTICKVQYKIKESYLVHLMRRHPELHAKYKQDKAAKRVCETENPTGIVNNIPLKRKKLNTAIEPETMQITEKTEAVEEALEFIDDAKIESDIVWKEPVSLKLKGIPQWQNSGLRIAIPTIQVVGNTNINPETIVIQDNEQMVEVDMVSIHEEVICEHPEPTQDEANKLLDNIGEESFLEEVVVEDFGGVTITEENVVDDLATPSFTEEYTVQECEEDMTVHGLKRSSGTQIPESIPNDETLSSWTTKIDFEMQTDGTSTQTVLDEILSLKPQNSEDEVFFSGAVSDIQTQTFASEFLLNRCNKETQYSTTLTPPDSSFKETQTCCFCLSARPNCRHFDCFSASPGCCNAISSDTPNGASRRLIHSDVMLSCSSAETQTCFNGTNDSM